MAGFLRVAGGIIVAASLLFFVVLAITTPGGFLLALSMAFPSVVAGVMVAAFGSMLDELQSIRAASKKQVSLLEDLLLQGRQTNSGKPSLASLMPSKIECPDCKNLERPDAATCSRCGLRLNR
ncbi:hypothetical protein B5K03_08770 [Rhizobium phaseoli]|uniref:hypothetical protein n=1 Tax=Rhizobium phaseoli TaxID=396 RepID=UPI000D67D0DA|nr:hypothetical protein [Rhizobium phaseoli]PWI54803.1 hypothetical protein B5K03_08770 [Rhizobium phaseoli]